MSLADIFNQKTLSADFLSSNENQAFHLFEQAPIAIAIFKGPDAVFELANKRALEIIGKTREEVIGRKLVEVLPELKEQGYLDIIKKVYNSGETFTADEAPAICIRDGQKIHTFIKYVFQPLKDLDGNITGVMLSGDDVALQV